MGFRTNTKYHSKKITANGMTFDSKKELRRYNELLQLQKAGVIHNLQRQVKFELIPTQVEIYERYSEKTGKRLKDGSRTLEKSVNYWADFVYRDGAGKMIVEDTKGFLTKEYIIKRKLMLYIHGIAIKEV